MTDVSQIKWDCHPSNDYGVGCSFVIHASLDGYHIQKVVTDVEVLASRIQIGFFRACQMQQSLIEVFPHD